MTGNEILGLRTNGNVKDRDTSKAARRRDGGKDGNRRGRKRNVKRRVVYCMFRSAVCGLTEFAIGLRTL